MIFPVTGIFAHLLKKLKELAVDIGFHVPYYTVTGWNSIQGAQIPVIEVIPVFGAYPEAPWADHIDKLPLSPHYVFNKVRNDTAIGKDLITTESSGGWQLPYENYPFATCELSGGLQVTHHRRPLICGMDIYALSLVKLGSGNNLIGYYMYKGGTNKIGALSTLNESKATGYPNDYPILNYDFQAPISAYGEIRSQYRLLNLLHLFVEDFGEILAPMETVMPLQEVSATDLKSLRYCMRTDGHSGFVFINHYQRLAKITDIKNAVIHTGTIPFPAIDIIGDTAFFLPFNLDLSGNLLEYALAQPLCRIGTTYFFVELPGITPEYKSKDSPGRTPYMPAAYQESFISEKTVTFMNVTVKSVP